MDPHVDVKEVRVKFALMAVGIRSAKASQQRSSTAFSRKRANSALSEAWREIQLGTAEKSGR